MTIHISEDAVRQAVDMPRAIELVEDVFRQSAESKASNQLRRRVHAGRVELNVMSAASETLGVLGTKVYTCGPDGDQFHVLLFDASTGQLLATIEADWLGQLRTGAASGVATKYMARSDSSRVGIIGAGKQARTQLMAVCAVRDVGQVRVWSRSKQRRNAFAMEMHRLCKTDVVSVAEPQSAVRDADIVVTATTASEPVIENGWVEPRTHINAIGSNAKSRVEIDPAIVARCSIVAVDSIDQAKIEAGDLVGPIQAGVLDWSCFHELGCIVAGKQTGRRSPDDVTLFKSLGVAIEDLAIAHHVFTTIARQPRNESRDINFRWTKASVKTWMTRQLYERRGRRKVLQNHYWLFALTDEIVADLAQLLGPQYEKTLRSIAQEVIYDEAAKWVRTLI